MSATRDAVPAAAATDSIAPRPDRRGLLDRLRPLGFQRVSGLYVWVLVFAIFALWVPETFLTGTTWKNIAGSQAVVALVTLGLLFPLAAGVYDLAIGQTVGLSAILSAYLVTHGLSTYPTLLAILAMGAVIGLVNSFLVVRLRINSFIGTLGVSSILIAMTGAVSNQQQIVGLPPGFTDLGNAQPLGIPITVLYLAVAAVVVWYALQHSPFGRYLYAIGGSPDAARLAGVPNGALVTAALVVSSVAGAFAGFIVTSKLGAGSPNIGNGYLLPCYAAAFLGATQIYPGRFNVVGSLIAVYLLATGVTGLQLAGANFWVTDLFNGVVLILALALATLQGRLRLHRLLSIKRRRAPHATERNS